jgi:hypothetical protein
MYTAAALAAANPLLLKGEVVYESDTRKRKVGDGISKWNDLAYDAGGDLPKMTPVAGADSVADFLGTSAPINDVLQKVIAATAIGKVRMVRFGGLQCMVWYIEGTTTVGVFGFVAENNAIAFGAVDDSEFPAGIFESTDEEIAAVVSYACSFIRLTAIPASYISTNTLYQFASATEKSTWNNKAANDLSNVSLTKLFSENGYYKAPDGMMFAWGTRSNQTTSITVYFPASFYARPYAIITTPTAFGDAAVEVAAADPVSASYFTMRPRYIKRLSNGQAEYGNSGCTFQYLAIGRWK